MRRLSSWADAFVAPEVFTWQEGIRRFFQCDSSLLYFVYFLRLWFTQRHCGRFLSGSNYGYVLVLECFRDDSAVSQSPSQAPQTTSAAVAGDQVIQAAYENRQSDVQVEGAGRVVKVLPDDNEGSRHQKFILELGSGQTILIAHNIDLAPRIPGLREGDSVAFYGEYEWNDKGGVVHWTHHDPQGRHADGWLKHQGKRYQ